MSRGWRRRRTVTELLLSVSVRVLVLHAGGTGPALGQAQLEVVTDADEEEVVGLLCLGEDLLEAGDLLGSEAAADADFKLTAAVEDSVTVPADVSLGEAGVGVTAAGVEERGARTEVSLVVRQRCPALDRVPAGQQSLVRQVGGARVVLQVPVERLVQFSQM